MSRTAAGLAPWFLQRLSSLYLGLYALFLAAYWLPGPVPDHAAWVAWTSRPLVALGVGIFLFALLLHLWVGLRNVLMDWVGNAALRGLLYGVLLLALAGSGLWVLRALWRAGL